jgi:hypothetical protein
VERPYLDREGDRPDGLARPGQRDVQVGRGDDRDPADLLISLR